MPAIPMFQKFLQSPIGRYLIVGGSVYVLEVIVILLAQHAGATDVEAVTTGFIIGLVISFILQKVVTFGDRRTHHKILLSQIVAVTLLVLWNLGFTVILTKALSGTIPAVITRTIALLVTTIWNFYLYRTRIFSTGATD